MLTLCGVGLVLCKPAQAQDAPRSENLLARAPSASTWSENDQNVILLEGGVVIDTDLAQLRARSAVIWLSALPGNVTEAQEATIALLGDAQIHHGQAVRTGERLLATLAVRGTIRITAEQRLARNLSESTTYGEASALRHGRPPRSAERPAPAATRPAVAGAPLRFQSPFFDTQRAADGTLAAVLSGGVTLLQQRSGGEMLELQAERAVLYTTLKSLRDADQAGQFRSIEEAVTAAYLEGDVRLTYTPPAGKAAEQRLAAERVFYDFVNDRAVLTDAVLHTMDPTRQIPVAVRAQVVRQLAAGEWTAEKGELTTSTFATPSYAIAAQKIYVRQSDTGDERLGTRTTFTADDATFRLYGTPVFYAPIAGGSITERGFPLRRLSLENSNRFGTGVRSQWGLFESLGRVPPRDLDMWFDADYFSDRGPAAGLGANYAGGFVTETSRDPWYFRGEARSYFVLDHGEDELGDYRRIEPDDEFRGRVLWEHQHYFPGDWQAQLRFGWVSDPTFLEQWFRNEFENGSPHDWSAYFKRQRESEAFTFLASVQPNDFVTNSDLMQEQFEVERLPQIGYHRVGDSLFDDNFTFFSDNTLARLRFNRSGASLAEQGFDPNVFGPGNPTGLPSIGQTGTTGDWVDRGDFRQEIDYPFTAGQFRVVPYVMGRYSIYSDSPADGAQERLLAGAGVRVSTAFWKVDDTAESRLFDIHRLRHVIEPTLHAFTSTASTDRTELYQFDEPIDGINDISAVQIGLLQRWQTQRGGPGRWRSVDFFTWNLEANFFANQPDDLFLRPTGFRGLYYPSLPEASIPRNSINSKWLWRISDSTTLAADTNYNLDESQLATAGLALQVRRDSRLGYYIGLRWIDELDSNILTVAADYQLSTKYQLGLSQSYDFGQDEDVSYGFWVMRRFDRLRAYFIITYDAGTGESGLAISVVPEGLAAGFNSAGLQTR